jgi:large subunit ribosomal protein L23
MSVLAVAQNKDPRDIIVAPVVSEKSYGLIDEGKYTSVSYTHLRAHETG